jgi:CHAT domain-containing protein
MILNNNARMSIDLGLRIAYALYEVTGDKEYLSEAFLFSENGKAIILLGALRGLEAKSTASIPKELLQKEGELNQEIATFNNLVYNEKQKLKEDQAKISLLNDTLFTLRKSFENLMKEYQNDYPDYYRLKYDYTIIPSDSVEKMLDENQAILEYHIADSVVFGFFIQQGQFYLKELGRTSDVVTQLDSLRHILSGSDYFNSGLEEFQDLCEILHELYKLLILPFEEDIKSKRLLIIPDAELGYLAFDILLSEEVTGGDLNYKNLPWLIREHPISYSSSATIYFEQSSKRKKQNASKALLAFAPKYEYISSVRNASSTDSLFYSLPPILGTEEEVNRISGLFRSKKFFNEQASEAKFKSLAPDFGILHLAMHTIIDNEKPLYSKLVFSKEKNDSQEDGYLNTYELFNLNLNGELAVLSACNTGTGKLERGEGIISLARGFFYSGIPSVVMTLWEIEDHSSADLVTLFYENLKKGMTKDAALQQAKLVYLQNSDQLHAHPYFWAGFVSIGKTAPMSIIPSPFPWNLILFIAIPALLITCALFLLKKRVFFIKNRIKH